MQSKEIAKSKILRLSMWLNIMAFCFSCDQFSTDLAKEPPKFDGPSTFILNSDGYFFTWPAVSSKKKVVYSILAIPPAGVVAEPLQSFEPAETGGRAVSLVPKQAFEDAGGEPVAEILASGLDGTSHLLPRETLSSDKEFILAVKADMEGLTGGMIGARVLMVRQIDIAGGGCSQFSENLADKSLTINFAWPGDAQQMKIIRNGMEVYSTGSKLVTAFKDKEIDYGETYEYRCVAIVDGVPQDTEPTPVTIPSPFDGYAGCGDVLQNGISGATVNFAFPAEAKKINIYRDNILLASIQDKNLTQFKDRDLKIGSTYGYQCEAQLGEFRNLGTNATRNLEITDPFADFTGCTVASTGVNKVVLGFSIPTGTQTLKIYRNNELATTIRDTSTTTFSDEGLKVGSEYNYSCEVQVEDHISDGNGTIKAKTKSIAEEIGVTLQGCLTSTSYAMGPSQAQISFEFPTEADKVRIYRDGTFVYQSNNRSSTIYTDTGLAEGKTYLYECAALFEETEVIGETTLSITTISTNAPDFNGITKVEGTGTNKATASWGVPNAASVPAATYQIFYNTGASLDWESETFTTVESRYVQTEIDNIGEEIQYQFGVRACSSNEVCDTNTATKTVTLEDSGAPPTTVGVSSLTKNNGSMVITAPWEPKDGGLSARLIYWKAGGSGSTNIDEYTLVKTVPVRTADIANPPTELTVDGLIANTRYHVIVRDKDIAGNISQNVNFKSLSSGDLSPPLFSGLNYLTNGTDGKEETTINVHFTAILQEAADPTGTYYYEIFLKEGGGDACTDGEKVMFVLSESYNSGYDYSIELTGLTAKTTYSVCMKAKDSDSNISETTTYQTITTLDRTAPSFDGVQGATYNPDSNELTITWNETTSTDFGSYKIKVWTLAAANNTDACSSNVSGAQTTTIGTKSTISKVFTTSDISFASEQKICVTVNVCDSESTPNCTNFADNTALSTTLPDIEPPTGFLGLKAPTAFNRPAQGQVEVYWNKPSDWTDYRGFKIYHSDGTNITLLKDCPCINSDCNREPESCLVENLDINRSYNFLAQPYDAVGNEATMNPAEYSTLSTTDTEGPTMGGSFSGAFDILNVQNSFSWSAASDNQFSGEINYILVRKVGSNFADVASPLDDGSIVYNGTALSFQDTSISASTDYFYTLCALDAYTPANRTCFGSSIEINLGDLTAPTITGLTTEKKELDQSWSIKWGMSDNDTAEGSLSVSLYRSLTDSPATATSSDTLLFSNVAGSTLAISPVPSSDPKYEKTGLTGPLNQDKYTNYLLVVKDAAGNQSTATLSVLSENKVTVTSVERSEGSKAGNKWIVIRGTGFRTGATATIEGVACTNPVVYVEGKYPLPYKYDVDREPSYGSIMGCITPSTSFVGAVDVTVTNTDSSSGTLTNGYTYCDPDIPGSCTSICDRPDDWNAGSNEAAEGDGSSGSPYILCNATHWKEMVDNYGASNGGRYMKLGDNISFKISGSPSTPHPLYNLSAAHHIINFDGQNYVMDGFNHISGTPDDGIGLFGRSDSHIEQLTVKNLGVVDFTLLGNDRVGTITSVARRPHLENLFTIGNVTGNNGVGGFLFSVDNVFPSTASIIKKLYSKNTVTVNDSGSAIFVSIKPGSNALIQDIRVVETIIDINGTVDYSDSGLVFGNIGYDTQGGANTDFRRSIDRIYVGKGSKLDEDVAGLEFYFGGLFAQGVGESFKISNIVFDDVSFETNLGIRSSILGYQVNKTSNGDLTSAGTVKNLVAHDVLMRTKNTTSFLSYDALRTAYSRAKLHGTFEGTQGATGIVNRYYDSSSYNKIILDADVSSDANDAIGFVSNLENNASFSEIAIHGNIFATGSNNAFGFIGTSSNTFDLTDSYISADVYSTSGSGQGFYNYTDGAFTFNRVFSTGKNYRVGGSTFPIYPTGGTKTITDVFWDTEASEYSTAITDALGKTTSEMQTQGTFTNYDFTTKWHMPDTGYPQLKFERQLWAAGALYSLTDGCSGTGGTLALLVSLVNHHETETAEIVTVDNPGAGSTISENYCDGKTLRARGGMCSFKLTFSSTPDTTADTSFDVDMASGDYFIDFTADGTMVDNVCP